MILVEIIDDNIFECDLIVVNCKGVGKVLIIEVLKVIWLWFGKKIEELIGGSEFKVDECFVVIE